MEIATIMQPCTKELKHAEIKERQIWIQITNI